MIGIFNKFKPSGIGFVKHYHTILIGFQLYSMFSIAFLFQYEGKTRLIFPVYHLLSREFSFTLGFISISKGNLNRFAFMYYSCYRFSRVLFIAI